MGNDLAGLGWMVGVDQATPLALRGRTRTAIPTVAASVSVEGGLLASVPPRVGHAPTGAYTGQGVASTPYSMGAAAGFTAATGEGLTVMAMASV